MGSKVQQRVRYLMNFFSFNVRSLRRFGELVTLSCDVRCTTLDDFRERKKLKIKHKVGSFCIGPLALKSECLLSEFSTWEHVCQTNIDEAAREYRYCTGVG